MTVLNMHSRETHRLPVVELKRKMGLEETSELPIERPGRVLYHNNCKYVLYCTLKGEAGEVRDSFKLVEVTGSSERILDWGEMAQIVFKTGRLEGATVHGFGMVIGYFVYDCARI